MKKPSVFSLAMSALSLMIFWTIMSGFLDAVHLSMGVFSVALALVLNYKLKSHRFYEDDMNDLRELRFGHAVFYFFWMIIQIIKAGIHVAKVIMSPSMPPTSQWYNFE